MSNLEPKTYSKKLVSKIIEENKIVFDLFLNTDVLYGRILRIAEENDALHRNPTLSDSQIRDAIIETKIVMSKK